MWKKMGVDEGFEGVERGVVKKLWGWSGYGKKEIFRSLQIRREFRC